MAEAWFQFQNQSQTALTLEEETQTPPNTPTEIPNQGSAFEILIEPLQPETRRPPIFEVTTPAPMSMNGNQMVTETRFQYPSNLPNQRMRIERQQMQHRPHPPVDLQDQNQNPGRNATAWPRQATYVRSRTRTLDFQPYGPQVPKQPMAGQGQAGPQYLRLRPEVQLRVSGCQEKCFQEKVKLEKSNRDLKRQLQELKDERLCKVCLDGPVSHVFIPCGHAVCCGTCVGNIKECPLCRCRLQGSTIIYFT